MTKQRHFIQAAFLLLFFGLIATGRVQLWIGVFAISLIGTFLFSRFYCGWLCPINTLMEVVNWFKQKTGSRRKQIPGWIKSPVVRYGVLAAFAGILVMTVRTGRKLPVLPALLVLGVLVTLVYGPVLWHRYLCPYGTILSLPGSFARSKYVVVQDRCTGCGVCGKVCPAEAVQFSADPKKAGISPSRCLTCTTCASACPTNAIVYGRGES